LRLSITYGRAAVKSRVWEGKLSVTQHVPKRRPIATPQEGAGGTEHKTVHSPDVIAVKGLLMQFGTPRELVEALRSQRPAAWRQLDWLCRPVVVRLLLAERERCGMEEKLEQLTLHTLHWIELYLRSCKPEEFNQFAGDEKGWRLFRNYLLVKTKKLFLWSLGPPPSDVGSGRPSPSGPSPGEPDAASALGCQTRYEFQRYCRPLKRVPGDMIEFLWINDKSFWVLVADGTGHSWLPYLLVQGLSVFWKSLVASPDMTPGKLFALLHEELQTCMPEGFYFEAALARFDSASVTIASAGDVWILVRQQGDPVARPRDLGDRGGVWLGLETHRRLDDQATWPFNAGDEITLASDGLSNQPLGNQRLRETLPDGLGRTVQDGSLHRDVLQILDNALARNLPDDDISIATVRRL
jgi:hypothetical protein